MSAEDDFEISTVTTTSKTVIKPAGASKTDTTAST